MKVTVTFGGTAVVVPCKDRWTVGDLVSQATQRYRKIVDQGGEFVVRTHHVEYFDGGILDQDDLLTDLVEDRDKLVAVFEEQEVQRGAPASPAGSGSTGHSSPAPYEPPYDPQSSAVLQPIRAGEIEVNAMTLKANTPLLVRSSSDSALAPPLSDDHGSRPDMDGSSSSSSSGGHALTHKGGAMDRQQTEVPAAKMNQVTLSTLTKTVEFAGDQVPLGIHVIPYCSSLSGRTLGLHIKGVEENSRSKREGIFQADESIVRINGTELMDKSFAESQEVFRQAMSSPLVRLEVLPLANKPRYEKSLIGQLFNAEGHDPVPKAKVPMPVLSKPDVKTDPKPDVKPEPKLEVRRPDARAKTPEPPSRALPGEPQAGATPVERPPSVSPTPRGLSESPLPKKSPGLSGLATLNHRKGGKKLKIDLKKGTEGLGFTVVTRDSSVHGPGPILVKNILPRGAAVKDGRLHTGDRILEVNGVDMTGRTQEELVAMLRSTKQGESVCVLVARQEEIFLPRELKGEDVGSLAPEDGREQLMFEVPLNESGSAGLGVSLKGNKSRETGEDLGIFIKSIIHGGAAQKDGRLQVNDQLIAVNGEALLGHSNHAAMETLRRSMSWEGNARGTIQLVLLRSGAPPQPSPSPGPPTPTPTAQESQGEAGKPPSPAPDGPLGPPDGPLASPVLEPSLNGHSQPPMVPNDIYHSSGAPPHPAPLAASNGSPSHYEEEEEEMEEEEDFPPPPSVEEINAGLRFTPPQQSEWEMAPYMAEDPLPDRQQPRHTDSPPTRTSKSMDLVADESNMGSLAEQSQRPELSSRADPGPTLGPTLGLQKSSSLESLQTAMSEMRQNQNQSQVPFHRPRPNMVRGRGCNQSFRNAIDRSYDGPSEDDDLSESSGRDTPVSGSSRQGPGEPEEGKKEKKKKTKGKKKEKKSKAKKKTEDPEDPDKKTKKRGFGLLRFGKKKEDKGKAEAKAAKQKLDALSEEELDKTEEKVRLEPRYMEVRDGQLTPEVLSLPDLEDDDEDPNYARINTFRQQPSPYLSRTPSPQRAPVYAPPSHSRQPSTEDLEGLYAKVNKPRPPGPSQTYQPQTHQPQNYQPQPQNYQPQSQPHQPQNYQPQTHQPQNYQPQPHQPQNYQPPPHQPQNYQPQNYQPQPQIDSDRVQQLRREFHQTRAAPAYEELEAARRRALDYDPPRMAVRGPETRLAPRYEEVERQYATNPRRVDPYDYPPPSRPGPREAAPYPGGYPAREAYPPRESQPARLPVPRDPESLQGDPRYYSSTSPRQHRAAMRQDVPPSPTLAPRGPRYETAGHGGYRNASPGRYASPEHYGYRDGKRADPRQKNAMVGAV